MQGEQMRMGLVGWDPSCYNRDIPSKIGEPVMSVSVLLIVLKILLGAGILLLAMSFIR